MVYLSNVEQIRKRFVEEMRGSLGKLIEDKTKWSSFCRFWSEIDPNSRRLMSKEKLDSILKLAVKQFFVEKEVASTLVMDTYIADLIPFKFRPRIRNLRKILGCSTTTHTYNTGRERQFYSG